MKENLTSQKLLWTVVLIFIPSQNGKRRSYQMTGPLSVENTRRRTEGIPDTMIPTVAQGTETHNKTYTQHQWRENMSREEETDTKDHTTEILVGDINSVHTKGEILMLCIDQGATITNILNLLVLGKHRKEVTEIFTTITTGDHLDTIHIKSLHQIDTWITADLKKETNTSETQIEREVANVRNVVNQIIMMKTAGLIKQ